MFVGAKGLSYNMTEQPNPSSIPMKGTLVIQVANASTQSVKVELNASEGYVLGRSDARSTYVPDIDFAPFKALEKGVSRRHAAFVRYQGRLHIVDLSSVNGTFLNGKKLKPEVPYMISNGDQIGLGDLALKLSLLEK